MVILGDGILFCWEISYRRRYDLKNCGGLLEIDQRLAVGRLIYHFGFDWMSIVGSAAERTQQIRRLRITNGREEVLTKPLLLSSLLIKSLESANYCPQKDGSRTCDTT